MDGVGEDLFKQIEKSSLIEIDPKIKNYTLIHEKYLITSNSINKMMNSLIQLIQTGTGFSKMILLYLYLITHLFLIIIQQL